jgi:hypothetical protein
MTLTESCPFEIIKLQPGDWPRHDFYVLVSITGSAPEVNPWGI